MTNLDGMCSCCGSRDVTTGGCLTCTSNTVWCSCGKQVRCGCGKFLYHSCSIMTVSPVEWSEGDEK